MKGSLHKTEKGWVVKYTTWLEDKTIAFNNEVPLHPYDYNITWTEADEGKEIEFSLGMDCVVGCSGTCGTCHHAEKYARLDKTIEKVVTESRFATDNKEALEKIERLQNEFVAYKTFDKFFKDDLFPNHTDRDIWVSGFMYGLSYRK